MEVLTGKDFYEGLDFSDECPFEALSEKDQFLFNLIAETAEEVSAEREEK